MAIIARIATSVCLLNGVDEGVHLAKGGVAENVRKGGYVVGQVGAVARLHRHTRPVGHVW